MQSNQPKRKVTSITNGVIRTANTPKGLHKQMPSVVKTKNSKGLKGGHC